MESLANKYRPRKFEDVVGQEHVITILKNQIKNNNIKQGYLFCGGAGTGKTTIARIFANEINKGKGAPIEIDAASNNGIENIRDIRENCKFKPIDSEYKVYIIDECHMLSNGAWNGFLKTLEEPPKHVIFILCTTDPQKIPATILSRLQRFDFKRMMPIEIIERLKYILEQENINTVDEMVLEYIAKMADGGMRDSISLLDTCLGYKKELTMDDIFDIFGTTNYETYISIIDSINNKIPDELIDIIEKLHYDGKDLKAILKGLMEFILEVSKYKIMQDISYVNIPSIYENELKKLINYKLDYLQLFRQLNEIYNGIKYESNIKIYMQGGFLCLI